MISFFSLTRRFRTASPTPPTVTRGVATCVAMILAVGAVLLSSGTAQADLIYNYNFNGTFAAAGGAKQAGATVQTSFASGSYNLTNAGTTVNAQTGEAAGTSLTVTGGSTNNAKVFQFSSGSTGYNSLVFSFAANTSSATSFNSFTVFGSNGTNTYTATITPTTTFARYGINFGSATLLNDNANTFFQIQFNGATDTVGTASIDNVQLNGTVVPTPEPSTYAMMAIGLVACLGVARKRREA